MTRVLILLAAAISLSGCLYSDYGAMPAGPTAPSVAGCPDSGGACSKGKG